MANQREEETPSVWAAPISAAIREALHGVTQKELASHLGVHPSTISQMLAGKIRVGFDDLAKIAERLNVTTRALLQRAGYIDIDTGELVDISLLNDSAKQSVLVLIGPRRQMHDVSGNGADHQSDGL